MRLSGAQRLRKSADFEAMRARSSGCVCSAFRLRILPTSTGLRRLGVIASKRVGNSVARSRAKRLLREAFRNTQDRLPPSCDVLLIASRPVLDMSGPALQCQYEERLQKALSRVKREGTS
ncbi:MAG: ribonuclease P protein component [Opitutales bacterium]|nr:ribonuclease P protein component [Opitutales bacterium]